MLVQYIIHYFSPNYEVFLLKAIFLCNNRLCYIPDKLNILIKEKKIVIGCLKTTHFYNAC